MFLREITAMEDGRWKIEDGRVRRVPYDNAAATKAFAQCCRAGHRQPVVRRTEESLDRGQSGDDFGLPSLNPSRSAGTWPGRGCDFAPRSQRCSLQWKWRPGGLVK